MTTLPQAHYKAVHHAMCADANLQWAMESFLLHKAKGGVMPEELQKVSAHIQVSRAHYKKLIEQLDAHQKVAA